MAKDTSGVPEPMLVSLSELEELTHLLLAHVRAASGNEVDLGADYYWDIPAGTGTTIYETAPQPVMGQYSDDLDWLRGMFAENGMPSGTGLVYLAALLRRVGRVCPL